MDENDDPYQILGVPHEATPDQIKKAYRKMALKHHPDKQSNASEEDRAKAGPIFVKISNAYELLSDDKERRYYDMQQQGRAGGGSSSPKKKNSRNSGFPSQTTYTTTSSSPSYTRSSTSKPSSHSYSTNDDHHFPHNFHDPFSVFEEVFREEFGGDFPDRAGSSQERKPSTQSTTNSDGDSDRNKIPPVGGIQVSMSTAMKLINGKQVTVMERVFQMPDGSLQTQVNKQVNNTKSKPTTTKSSASPTSKSTSISSSPRRSGNKPTVTTKIVNGQKETTTEYPDGRVESKVEPPKKKRTSSFQTPPASPLTMKSPSKSASKNKTTTKIINGKKEITTEYPDGRIETHTTSPRTPSTSSLLPAPVKQPTSKATSISSSPRRRTGNKPTVTTKIVNGQKETITEYPDGRVETKVETPKQKKRTSVFQTPPMSPLPSSNKDASKPKPKTSTKIVNGKKEITTEYPDGRIETQTMSPRISSTSSLSPAFVKQSYDDASPRSITTNTTSSFSPPFATTESYDDDAPPSTSSSSSSVVTSRRPTTTKNNNNTRETLLLPHSIMSPSSTATAAGTTSPGPGSSNSHQTRIVNGQKETMMKHTITRPNGTMETRFEKKVVAM